MICLNSAGNLVRFEVGTNMNGSTNQLLFIKGRLSRRRAEACWLNPRAIRAMSVDARSEDWETKKRNGRATKRECGGRPTRAARASGQLEPATVAGPPSLHLEPRSRLTTATTVQCAGKSLRRWVELCRPSNGRGQRTDPWPQYAFKVSMFNVSCNSH